MKIFDLIVMCVRNLTRRKFRTFLTVSGVVIGTCSIVIMISLGVGISISTEAMLAGMSDLTMIQVYSQSTETPLTDEVVQSMQAMENVVVASPTMRYYPNNGYTQLFAGRRDRYSSWADLVGVYPEALEKLGYAVNRGELELGSDGKKIQVVMGPQVPYSFMDTKKRWPNNRVDGSYEDPNAPDPFFDPMDTEMAYRLYSGKEEGKELVYTLVTTGILAPKDNDWESISSIYISIDDLKKIKADFDKLNRVTNDGSSTDGYDQVKVKVDHVDHVGAVQDAIKEMGFHVESMEATREAMQQSTQQIQTILGILGAVALIVAAISIVNTMIMSVYERTREIGVMKVLGCLLGNIRTIFLIEAGMIGFIGGVIGIGVSYIGSFLINRYGGAFSGLFGIEQSPEMATVAQLSVIPFWLVLAGLAIATAVGLFAGFYPAERAVRISALEAIRQE